MLFYVVSDVANAHLRMNNWYVHIDASVKQNTVPIQSRQYTSLTLGVEVFAANAHLCVDAVLRSNQSQPHIFRVSAPIHR
jgi:hypothetical protein